MIFVTGDVHAEYDIHKFNTKNFPQQRQLNRSDYMIVTGDFGLVWDGSAQERYWRNWLNSKSFTTLFVDGNHENFDMLEQYPIELWCGGKVRRIEENILHLQRGQVFTIDDKKFFTFGGAQSTDKEHRIIGKSWWPQELPNYHDIEEAYASLAPHDFKVDYVLTHTAPTSVVDILVSYRKDDPTCRMLDLINKSTEFDKWFFGHFHTDVELEKFTCLYEKILHIE